MYGPFCSLKISLFKNVSELSPNLISLSEPNIQHFEFFLLKKKWPRETIPKLSGAYMRTPPENVKNRDFPQFQYAVKFFWGEIPIHNKSIKCQFRLELSNARNHMLTASLEKKLEG